MKKLVLFGVVLSLAFGTRAQGTMIPIRSSMKLYRVEKYG